MLQEFDLEVHDKKAEKYQVTDHLSRLESHACIAEDTRCRYYEFASEWCLPLKATSQQRKKLFYDSRSYVWDESYLLKHGPDGIVCRCVSKAKSKQVLQNCHSSPYVGHHGGERTA